MSFGELLMIMVIGLVVLGPERLPVAIRTVAGWIRVLRSLSTTVQTELAKELKLEEVKETISKAEKAGLQDLSPELNASMEELRQAAESMQQLYRESGNQILSKELNTSTEPSVAPEAAISAAQDTKPTQSVPLDQTGDTRRES